MRLAASSQTRTSWRPRLLLLIGIALMALNVRSAATAVSPVLADVRADLALTTTGAGLLGMLPPFAFAVFGVLTPSMIRRLGLERTAWLAMALAGAGQVLRGLAPGQLSFLTLSLVALGGMGMGNVVLPPLVKRYFPDRVAVVTGGYVLLLAAGTALPPLLAVPVADAAGWRISVGQWGLFALVAALPWVVSAVRARRSATGNETARATSGARGDRPHLPFTAVVRSRVAWGLAALMGMTSLNTYAMLAWLPELLRDAGVTEQRAGAMLALYAAVGMPGALLVPALAARMRNPLPIVLLCLVGYLVGYVGLVLSPASSTPLWVTAAGLGPAAFPLALALVNLRSRTEQGSAALSGFAQGIGYAVAGVGPLVVGVLRDATGGWSMPMAFLGVTLAVQVAGAVVVCRPRMVEDDLPAPAAVGPRAPGHASPEALAAAGSLGS